MFASCVIGLILGATPPSATGAPTVQAEFDLFDYLATTFPLQDWVMHARDRSNTLIKQQPTENYRVFIETDNTASPEPDFVVATGDMPLGIRPLRRCNSAIAVVDDPCDRMVKALGGKARLPSLAVRRTPASMGIGPPPILSSRQ